jgi:hypothetical protein
MRFCGEGGGGSETAHPEDISNTGRVQTKDATGVDEPPTRRAPLDWLWLWPAFAIISVALLVVLW